MTNAGNPNTVFDHVFSFVEFTNRNIFLTGKAGTGKTTLLWEIKEKTTKKMAIVAPTGIAAMNARGTTINSFFQLPPGSFFPGDIRMEDLQSGIVSIQSMVADLSYSRDKLNLFKELQLLVIDEVSMVRCDLMDVIDATLRAVRKNNSPFGGVQLLLIGDLFQLPPVVKREEWAFLSQAYPSPYFFDAQVIHRYPLLQVELTTVFRQTEPEFINILNDIRNNQISEKSLSLLNERYDPAFNATDDLIPIIITSHNAEANSINQEKLDQLPGIEHIFEGSISGEFRDLGLQAEQLLKLKEGAQIMFIKNDTGDDRKFYNGKIGKVKSISNSEIYISFPNEADLLLEKSVWQSFEYKADSDEAIVQQQVGEFSQYPVKLAWAVTIHKSQGLTFDHAVIDAGKSFVTGQVYVALSRVRTLNGLILKSKIGTESLRSNPEVINYMNPLTASEMAALLPAEQEKFILKLVLDHFSLADLLTELNSIIANPEIVKSNLSDFKSFLEQINKSVSDLIAVAGRFQSQLNQLHQQHGFKGQQLLQERIGSAMAYFVRELNTQIINPVSKHIRTKPANKLQQQIQHLLQKYRQVAEHKIAMIQHGSELLKEPVKQEDYVTWIVKNKTSAGKKSTSRGQAPVALQLF